MHFQQSQQKFKDCLLIGSLFLMMISSCWARAHPNPEAQPEAQPEPQPQPDPDRETAHLSIPNTSTALERVLGFGVVFPHPFFQKPRHRYPVYDRSGRGYLTYGYGGRETHRYTKFDKIYGHH